MIQKETWYWNVTTKLGLMPPIAVVGLGGFLIFNGMGVFQEVSLGDFLSLQWQPIRQQFGIPLIVLGTLLSTILALGLAVPIGLSAALYLTLYASPKVRAISDASIALLGGMPSVVIGLWAMVWIVPSVGNSLAAASLTLALMITPTFTLLAGAALRQAPPDLVEATRALGVSEGITAWVLVRHARWGVLGAAILAASRGLGEAVAVSMVAGNVPSWPALFGPISTLTTTLILELDVAAGLHRDTLYLLAAIVMGLIVGVSITGRHLLRKRTIH